MEKELTQDQAKKILQHYQANPIEFSKEILGISLWKGEEELLDSLAKYDRVTVKSGHALGKDFTAGVSLLWFLNSFPPAIVIVTAPTERQVDEIVWGEVRSLYSNAKVPLPGKLLESQLTIDDKYYAIGFTTKESKEMTGKFQGFHSPNILVIVSEAQAVEAPIYEQIEGILTSQNSKLLLIGNPLSPTGKFYESFQNPKYKKITLSCLSSPNYTNECEVVPGLVSKKWVDEKRDEWGEKSSLWQSRVLGEFPSEGTDTLIPLVKIDEARNKEMDVYPDDPITLACDIARYGDAKSVFVLRKGDKFLKVITREKIPTMASAGIIKGLYMEELVNNLVIDDVGVGGGVVDRLREQNVPVFSFNGGAKQTAMDIQHFKNLRSEFYWYVKKKFEAGEYSISQDISERDFEILKSQLSSIKYKIESDGKIKVESKDDMLARGLKSPDYADAFMMSEYAKYCSFSARVGPYKWR